MSKRKGDSSNSKGGRVSGDAKKKAEQDGDISDDSMEIQFKGTPLKQARLGSDFVDAYQTRVGRGQLVVIVSTKRTKGDARGM